MQKSLLYRIFGLGAIPNKLRPIFDAEHIVIADEGMKGQLICKNIKAPGKRFINRTEGFSGCLVVTQKRIACFTYWKRQINIAVDDPKLAEIFVDMPNKDFLTISFESSNFRGGWNGIIEFQFNTNKARELLEVMTSLGVNRGIQGEAKK